MASGTFLAQKTAQQGYPEFDMFGYKQFAEMNSKFEIPVGSTRNGCKIQKKAQRTQNKGL